MDKYKEEYVAVNGIEHFLLHYPKTSAAPVLLYLHGGPGNFESLFAYELDEVWGDLFTHVHWDQRGAGKTLRRNKRNGMPESLNQMLHDLHGIIKHLQHKYSVKKIVVLGHSWGSVLGSLYAQKHPENVLSYIGCGQVISMMENERTAFLEVREMARKAGNQKHLKALDKLGDYPPKDPELLFRQLVKFRKIQQVYDNGPVSGSGLWETVTTLRRSPSFQWGDLISFMRVMKVNHPLFIELLSFNLLNFPSRYEVPVHYILGDADTITPTSLAKAYYDTISAPDKTITVIPGAGHNPMYEKPQECAAALRTLCEPM